jgi:hypothetical protein
MDKHQKIRTDKIITNTTLRINRFEEFKYIPFYAHPLLGIDIQIRAVYTKTKIMQKA